MVALAPWAGQRDGGAAGAAVPETSPSAPSCRTARGRWRGPTSWAGRRGACSAALLGCGAGAVAPAETRPAVLRVPPVCVRVSLAYCDEGPRSCYLFPGELGAFLS